MKSRAIGETSTELGNAVLALVKNRTAKERLARDIECHFRQPLRRIKEFVGLKTAERGEGITGIPLCDRNDVVRLWIELEFTLEKILEHEFVAQLGHVRDRSDVLGDLRPALE